MSTHNKLSNGTHTANHPKRPQPDVFKVSDIVSSRIRELIPPERQKVFFRFQGNLRTYLSLQSQASGKKTKLSNIISFTSRHIGPDALAAPASTYVENTWGTDGTKILRLVDDAIRTDQVRQVGDTLDNCCNILITAHENHLDLIIKGPQNSFARVVEQVCWLVCVAGEKPITHLAKYVKQTNKGTTTRAEVETIYTERPIITSKDGCHVHVSFAEASVEDNPKASMVKTPGHCWKTMTGLTIIARGFPIPPRPRHGSGLEASLAVLRQLFRRGSPSTCPVAMDKPMALFPPPTTKRIQQAGKAADVYELRLIMAADCERPLRARRNVIYWHFDPARICASTDAIQELEDSITVEPWAVDPDSRHFVGWTKSAGLLATATKPIPSGGFGNLPHIGHFHFVISSIGVNVRLPAFLAVALNITTEKVETTAPKVEMADRDLALEEIRGRVFVIWDVDRERGWLLRGDTVALHLLRLYIQRKYTTEQLDFSSLQILKDAKDDVSPAYRVLDWLNNQETSLNRVLEVHPDTEDNEQNKKETKKEDKKENTKEEQLKTSLGPKLDRMYAHLLNMSMESPKLNRHEQNPSGTLRTWFKKKWGTTLRGWDFKSIAYLHEPTTYDWKMDKDPGWLEMAKELGATFLFAKGMGELLDPVPESSCCHFPTLPAGKSFLASNMETLSALIEKYGGDDDMGDPPDKTVARLSRHQGWEKGLDPFEREGCKGQHDHLGTLGPNCFPVQSLQNAKYQVKFQKRAAGTETELIQQKKLYTKREIQLMMSKHPKGVVVFGHQPEAEELKAMCRRRTTGATQSAVPTSAHPAEKSSSQGSTQVSTKTTPGAVSTAGPGRSSIESARRAPSIDSNRSAASNTQARASGATNASAHPRARGSTPKSSAASVRTAASSASLRSIGSNSHLKALQGNSSGTGKAQSKGSQPLKNSPSNASLKSISSATHPGTSHDISHGASQPQASPATPVQKAASNASLRSNASSTHIKAFEGSSTRAAQPQVSASGSAENLMHRAVSSASLRSNNSAARIMDPNAGFCRPNEPDSQQSAPNPNRQPSSSSVRTTSSVASRASGDSQTQRSSSQPPDMGLRKTTTNSSQRSTGSHSSRARENLAAFASNRQRQQPLEQAGNAATAAGNLPPGQPANPNQLMSSAGTTGNRSAASGTSPAPHGA